MTSPSAHLSPNLPIASPEKLARLQWLVRLRWLALLGVSAAAVLAHNGLVPGVNVEVVALAVALGITTNLIDADQGVTLWSANYDRQLNNIFQVQDEIARAVVLALEAQLLNSSEEPVERALHARVEVVRRLVEQPEYRDSDDRQYEDDQNVIYHLWLV